MKMNPMATERLFRLTAFPVLTDIPWANADTLYFQGSYLKNNQSTFCNV